MLQTLKADAKSFTKIHKNNSRNILKLIIVNYSFRIVLRYRLSNYLCKRNKLFRIIGLLLYWANKRRGVDISPLASIGSGLRMVHPIGIVIGDRAIIGNNCHILQNVTIDGNSGKTRLYNGSKIVMPVVLDNVLIAAGAVIIGPVIVGNNCVIGANSVVLHDVQDMTVVGGIPAKVLKKEE